jgi:hypothetical protein
MKELKQKKILGWGQSTIPDKMLVLANPTPLSHSGRSVVVSSLG